MAISFFKKNIAFFLLALALGILYYCIAIYNISNNSLVQYRIEQWVYASDFFVLVYPLFCSVPFCWRYYIEKKDGYLKYVLNRTSLKSYLFKHYLTSAFMAGLCVFLVSFSGVIIALEIVSPQHIAYQSQILKRLFGIYVVNSPYLFGLCLSLWRMLIGILVFTLGFVFALLINNIFVVVIGPFIYTLLENYIWGLLWMPSKSICTSFNPLRLKPGSTTIIDLLIGPSVLIAFMILTILYIILIKFKGKIKCLHIIVGEC